MGKPRIVKDYEKLSEEIIQMIKLTYPYGFTDHLIKFTNAEGKLVDALPFETDDFYYLVRMTPSKAESIIEDDDDYDDDGNLKAKAKKKYLDELDLDDDLLDDLDVGDDELEESGDVSLDDDSMSFDDIADEGSGEY